MSSIQSVQFGEMNIDPAKIISFPKGLPGFESATRFMLCHEEGNHGIVHFLQSVDEGALVFSVGDPSQFGIHYQFTLTDDEQALLELTAMEDLLVLLLLYRDEQATSSSEDAVRGAINAPLVINIKTRKGLQKVMDTVAPSVLLSEISNPVE